MCNMGPSPQINMCDMDSSLRLTCVTWAQIQRLTCVTWAQVPEHPYTCTVPSECYLNKELLCGITYGAENNLTQNLSDAEFK